jgi:small subunit ribosomal protein S13
LVAPAQQDLRACGIDYTKKIKDLSDANSKRSATNRPFTIEGDLRRETHEHQAPDGHRLLPWFPPSPWPAVRGQRTKTNARTRKGPRKAAQSLKK